MTIQRTQGNHVKRLCAKSTFLYGKTRTPASSIQHMQHIVDIGWWSEDCIYIEKADLQFSASSGGDDGEGGEAAADAEDENVGSVQLLGALQTVSCFGSRCVTLHHGITSQLCMPKDLLFHVVSSCVFFPLWHVQPLCYFIGSGGSESGKPGCVLCLCQGSRCGSWPRVRPIRNAQGKDARIPTTILNWSLQRKDVVGEMSLVASPSPCPIWVWWRRSFPSSFLHCTLSFASALHSFTLT